MRNYDWLYWFWIKKSKQGRSLERWALRHLHQRDYLNLIAEKIMEFNNLHSRPCLVQVNSIWIDGTPQASAKARTKEIKCELADLLYIVEELNHKGEQISRKGLLIQGKNTIHPRKIDSGNSTKKERALFEKLDRMHDLVLKSGVSNNSKTIGSYLLDSSIKQGLSDCARFLLMPKGRDWFYETIFAMSPFHITWPRNETSNEMVVGFGLSDAILEMYNSNSLGKAIISPEKCEWSRMVIDLENKYKGIEMQGYDRQKRYYSSDTYHPKTTKQPFQYISIHSEKHYLNEKSDFLENSPYISIIKISIQYPEQDEYIEHRN